MIAVECNIAASPINHLQSCSRSTNTKSTLDVCVAACVFVWLAGSVILMKSNCSRWQIKAKIQFQWHTTRTDGNERFLLLRTLSVRLSASLYSIFMHPSLRRMPMLVLYFQFLSPQKWDSLSFGRPRPTHHHTLATAEKPNYFKWWNPTNDTI